MTSDLRAQRLIDEFIEGLASTGHVSAGLARVLTHLADTEADEESFYAVPANVLHGLSAALTSTEPQANVKSTPNLKNSPVPSDEIPLLDASLSNERKRAIALGHLDHIRDKILTGDPEIHASVLGVDTDYSVPAHIRHTIMRLHVWLGPAQA